MGVIKKRGITYAGGGGGGDGVDYSTTEHKTGRKWIDGKDIWEKTVVSTATPSSTSWITVNLDLPTGAVILMYDVYYVRASNRRDKIPQYNPSNSNEWTFGSISNNNFVYKVSNPYITNFVQTEVTIQYTKSS